MYLEDYLKKKHMDYCVSKNEMISESDWVGDVLNKNLPRGDQLSYPSVNQWMNGGRNPDSKNIIRLIKVFGPEVMPYLGINFSSDLYTVVSVWDELPEDEKEAIHNIVRKDNQKATLQV